MDNLIAVEEGVILIIDKNTHEVQAILRPNGRIEWLKIKGEPTWDEYRELLSVQSPTAKKHEPSNTVVRTTTGNQ